MSSTDRGPGDVKEAPGVFCCGGLVGHHNGGLIYDWAGVAAAVLFQIYCLHNGGGSEG